MDKKHNGFFVILAFFQVLLYANSQSFIGVNYGEAADNLPAPSATAKLLQSTTIGKLRLYNVDAAMINSLANTGISVVVGTTNADIPKLASDPSFASQWLSANVLPHLPSSAVSVISVGNEFLNYGDPSQFPQLLPAMKNLQSALPPGSGIKVSTVHAMAVLAQSNPPSSAAFRADLAPVLTPILAFLSQAKSPFMINPYPYFAYRDDPRPDTLAFCLFQPNPGRFDPGSKITYTNMFDAQVDAVKSAVNAAGFADVEIVVAETGWPYNGDANEVGATMENAKAFTGGLVSHLRSMVGTPLIPGKSVDTFIFELYDENLKGGPTSERSFGLYRTDQTAIYDVGLSRSASQLGLNATAPPPSPNRINPKAAAPPPPLPRQPQSPVLQQPKSPVNQAQPASSSAPTWNSLLPASLRSLIFSICAIFLIAILGRL